MEGAICSSIESFIMLAVQVEHDATYAPKYADLRKHFLSYQ